MDKALPLSKPEVAYYDTYFTSWGLNSIGQIYHLMFTRLLHEALFAASALTFFSEVSPCNALFGRRPAMPPDLPVLDHEQQMETSGHNRGHTIRR
eukprot:9292036-Pyramimonas_sp.AAC.1